MDRLHLHHHRRPLFLDPLHPRLLPLHAKYTPLHSGNFYITNYPVDDTGASCYYNQTDAPFIHFQNIDDLTSKKNCLVVCPNSGEGLQCSAKYPCPGLVSSYNTTQVMNELGGFCLPTDKAMQDKFWQNPVIAGK